ncbi:hypothetical protein [Allorhizocola rhizosphaerae]|uniref:bestrophin-like domain n=1 Tax=Allorhizocola rhizosphaerae TaxID=1872709 RepID=UPI0013C347AF|nr:hypothetical protein [Allorhizocola rhizosphaerae]
MTATVHIGVQWIVSGVVLVILVSLVAAGLVYVIKRVLPQEKREAEFEAIGFVFAVIGVLYAIALAFVVIDVWQGNSSTEAEVYREAHALVEQYRYAGTLPGPQGAQIQQPAREYADHVLAEAREARLGAFEYVLARFGQMARGG